MRKSTQKGQTAPRRVMTFTQAGALLSRRVRSVGEKRGFAVTRLLTQWTEICGTELAAIARPVRVSYSRDGFGATLILACDGARAPEIQMQTETIRTRVNACYGYNAISRIRITQEDAQGFAEAQRAFAGPAKVAPPDTDRPEARHKASEHAAVIEDGELRLALERLGANILSKDRAKTS